MNNFVAIRAEVLRFASLMELRLRQNDHKPGWDGESLRDLLVRLRQEASELSKEIGKRECDLCEGKVAEEAADVANFAMMIADNSRDLPPFRDTVREHHEREAHDLGANIVELERIIFALILAYDIDGEALSSAAFLPPDEAYLLVEKARAAVPSDYKHEH